MSVQIKFTISLESNTLSTSAVTSLNSASSSGQLATTFSQEAFERNEVDNYSTFHKGGCCDTLVHCRWSRLSPLLQNPLAPLVQM
jgi:hypothetical protein